MAEIENIFDSWEGHSHAEVENALKSTIAKLQAGSYRQIAVSIVGSLNRTFVATAKKITFFYKVNSTVDGTYNPDFTVEITIGNSVITISDVKANSSDDEIETPNLAPYLAQIGNDVITVKILAYTADGLTAAAKSLKYTRQLCPMCFVIDQRWFGLSDPVGMVSKNYILGSDGTLQSISNSGADGNPNNNTLTWLRQNTHAYVGRYTGFSGIRLKQLDDTTRKKFADGTSAVDYISNESGEFDVWMKINSDIYIKTEPWTPIDASVPDPDYVLVTIARELPVGEDETKWEKFSKYNLYGVYEACRINNKLYSLSGKRPVNRSSQTQSKSQARARGNGFKLVDYKFSKLLAFLFYGYYSTLDSQAQCGCGTVTNVGGVYYPKITGLTDLLAGTDTTSTTGNGAATPDNDQIIAGTGDDIKSTNFWHIENFQGDMSEWLDNMIVMQAKRPSNVHTANPQIYLDDYVAVYGYPKVTKLGKDYQLTEALLEEMNEAQLFVAILDRNGNVTRIIQYGNNTDRSEGYIKKMCFGDHADIFVKEFGASTNTGFCDYGCVSFAGKVALRSNGSAYTDGGVSCLFLDSSTDTPYSNVGSRLQFDGTAETIHIIDDATESL